MILFQRFILIIALTLWVGAPNAQSEIHQFSTAKQLQDFEKLQNELRCITCPNQTIADSQAPVAKAMQEEIVRRIQNGESVDSIKDYLLGQYGEYILYRPLVKKQNYILWLGPFLVLAIGALLWFKQSRRKENLM